MPRLKPPFFPAAKGLYLQPTIVNNVETLSNVPWIIAEGGAAFRDLGAADVDRHAHVRGVRSRQPARACSRCRTASRRSASCFDAPEYCGGVRGPAAS